MIRDELIKELMKYPNVEVRVTWESTVDELNADEIYMSKDGIILIDGDDNSYKKLFISGQLKAIDEI